MLTGRLLVGMTASVGNDNSFHHLTFPKAPLECSGGSVYGSLPSLSSTFYKYQLDNSRTNLLGCKALSYTEWYI